MEPHEARGENEIIESIEYRLSGTQSKLTPGDSDPGNGRISIYQTIRTSRVVITVGLSFKPMQVPAGVEEFLDNGRRTEMYRRLIGSRT